VDLVRITRKLSRRVDALEFRAPVSHVYNPLAYARAAHEQYLERWGAGKRRIVLLGMNPGPFGMAQTGVPFGEVELVRHWLGIDARVGKPAREHPKRPVEGFGCQRSEVSGKRLWGFARDRFGTPQRFFREFVVLNYCPLAFMESSGKNRTPDKLPEKERIPLFRACDDALREAAGVLEPEIVIGVGAFAEKRARLALEETGIRVAVISHPSPASPKANRGWDRLAAEELAALDIRLPHVER
jgi:single-strand selective monofunctional uracil DNA glycosylase